MKTRGLFRQPLFIFQMLPIRISRLIPSLLLPLLVFTATAAVQKSTAAKKKTPTKSAARKTGKTSSSKTKTAVKTGSKSSKKGSKKPSVAATTWRNRQSAPSPERYKEIQQALYEKGYLKTPPTGVWDVESTNAMKQFQSERKLTPTGKVNAPSLIDLGLGPKHNTLPPAPAAPSTPGENK